MIKFFYIGIGGATGALLRYWISGFIQRFFNGGFPWGTLSVNLIGALIIGFLWGAFESVIVSQNIKLFCFIGVLGSFTTFSTFSIENFHLLRDGEYNFFAINVLASFILGMILVFAGYFLSRYLFSAVH
ncbi:MAG: fluoride efflux transporter CrcB [Candidatus Omnitrophica bacterium]|nr:fluoride efflux transporter CrcB [Candidatus Omnitrophota bacterium]